MILTFIHIARNKYVCVASNFESQKSINCCWHFHSHNNCLTDGISCGSFRFKFIQPHRMPKTREQNFVLSPSVSCLSNFVPLKFKVYKFPSRAVSSFCKRTDSKLWCLLRRYSSKVMSKYHKWGLLCLESLWIKIRELFVKSGVILVLKLFRINFKTKRHYAEKKMYLLCRRYWIFLAST